MHWRILVIIGLLLGHSLGLLLAPSAALAVSGSLYISELQTGGSGTGHANDEFVELYNGTDNDIPLHGWQLEYRAVSASNGSDCAKGWSKTAALPDAVIKSHRFFLLADKNYALVADARFSFDLSGTAGTVHVLNGSKQVVDALAWGDGASCGLGRSAALAAGQSLERLPGAQVPQGGNAYDTGDNANDFMVRSNPEPQAASSPGETPLEFADFASTDATTQLELSELLVTPAADDTAGPFIEFHNSGTAAVALNAYVIKLGLVGYYLPQRVLLPGAYVAIHSETFPVALDPTGGTASLLGAFSNTVDTASWPAAPVGASRVWDGEGWTWTAHPTPDAVNELVPLPSPVSPPDSASPAPIESGVGSQQSYPALDITELLPDPAAPATDADDEFIELHNPGPTTADLSGYTLKTGNSQTDVYTIGDITLDADGYIVFNSADTHIALANTGSSVALYDPTGQPVGSTVSYPTAKTGEAWARFGAGWSWTTTPTPGQSNVLSQPTVLAASATAAKATAKTVKTITTKAPAKPKTPTVKAAAKPKVSKSGAKPLLAGTTTTGGRWLLFILAGLTIAYIIYEFRYDIRNYYYKLRGYPIGRLAPVPVVEGRGSDRTHQRPRRR